MSVYVCVCVCACHSLMWCKADCVWVGRKILEAKGKSRSTTFLQREKRNFHVSKRGFPFGRDLRRPTQMQSALPLQMTSCEYEDQWRAILSDECLYIHIYAHICEKYIHIYAHICKNTYTCMHERFFWWMSTNVCIYVYVFLCCVSVVQSLCATCAVYFQKMWKNQFHTFKDDNSHVNTHVNTHV